MVTEAFLQTARVLQGFHIVPIGDSLLNTHDVLGVITACSKAHNLPTVPLRPNIYAKHLLSYTIKSAVK